MENKLFKSRKYPQLNDSNWLREKYLIEKLSLTELGKIIGCKNQNSVREAIIGLLGIVPRNLRESQIVNREDDKFLLNNDFIDGCLLGDGYLRKFNKESTLSKPYFVKKNKFYNHVLWVASNLYEIYPESHIIEDISEINEKQLKYYLLRTKSYDSLQSYYDRWYPSSNDYKKIIPNDVCISPVSLLNMFLDDGSSYRRIRNGKITKQIIIKISLQGFTPGNLEMFRDKINREYNLHMTINSCNSGYGKLLNISQKNVKYFYEIIGQCPIDELKYKWKII